MEDYRNDGVLEMGWEDFITAVDFCRNAGLNTIHLLGGEPTRHSKFLDILVHLNSLCLGTYVVTNGIVQPSLVDSIVDRKLSGLQFGVNSTPYSNYNPQTKKLVDYFLQQIENPIMLGYTITANDLASQSVTPILERASLIRRHLLTPHLQFQIAVPNGYNTNYVRFHEYPAVVELLSKWSEALSEHSISIGLDCHCVPTCKIPQETCIPITLTSQCTQFMIDIGPDLVAWPCFPVSTIRKKLSEFRDISDMQAIFRKDLETQGVRYEAECLDCQEHDQQSCDAGCWGFQLIREPQSELP
jgi:hypothetical protein